MNLNKENLQKLLEENKTLKQIAEIFKTSDSTIKRRIKTFEIIKEDKFIKFDNKNWLYEQYITLNKSMEKIAEENNVSRFVILKRLEKYDIKKTKDVIKQNREKTCIKKYGVSNPNKSKEVRNKTKETCLKRYGVENNLLLVNKQKILTDKFFEEKILKLNNIIPLFTKQDYIGTKLKNYNFKCNICNTEFETYIKNGHIPRCPKCFPKLTGTSNLENKLYEFVNITDKINNKRFYDNNKYKYELDIFIPSKNIGIELNGVYWHSEISGQKLKSYHLNKTNYFNQLGVQVLHFWDSEWNDKQDLVKSIIDNKLGLNQNKIYARKCEIKQVNPKIANIFLNENHLQGVCPSSIKLGLYHDNELVSLLTLVLPRMNKNYDYEIARFCNKLNTSVIGGFSKLFNYFVKNYEFSNIITYADKRISNGGLYQNNGFTLLRESEPNYFYTKDYKLLESRNKYQKHKLKELLPNYNSELTEWENMQLHGYDRIWDCGNYVFEYNKKTE